MARNSDSSGTHLWLVLMKAHRSLARHAAHSVAALELGHSDFAILEILLHKGPQPVNAIGRSIRLTSGSITTAVDRLESRGLVARGSAANDRRTRVVRLTPEGKACITKAFAKHKTVMDRTAEALSKAELDTLIRLLKKLGTHAEGALGDTGRQAHPR